MQILVCHRIKSLNASSISKAYIFIFVNGWKRNRLSNERIPLITLMIIITRTALNSLDPSVKGQRSQFNICMVRIATSCSNTPSGMVDWFKHLRGTCRLCKEYEVSPVTGSALLYVPRCVPEQMTCLLLRASFLY